ncbi:hypothetical protein, partial [Agaricicola taiwanensis]|uniref:hypothetical protein n=1 Tax=Agaricicola taiwanensis TaxID=591372 RepID=UPI00166AE4EC
GATEDSIKAHYKEKTGKDLPDDFFTKPFKDQLTFIEEAASKSSGTDSTNWGPDEAPKVVALLQEYDELRRVPAEERTEEQKTRLQEVSTELKEKYGLTSFDFLFGAGNGAGVPGDLPYIAQLMGMTETEGATQESISAYYKEKTGKDLPADFFTKPFAEQLPIIAEAVGKPSETESSGWEASEASTVIDLLEEYHELISVPEASRTDQQKDRIEEIETGLAKYGITDPGNLFRTTDLLPDGVPGEDKMIALLMGMGEQERITRGSISEFYKEKTGKDLPADFFSKPFAEQLPIIAEAAGDTE